MINENSSTSYDARLRRLERQNRKLRAGMTLIALCLTVGLLLGAAQSGVFGTITAERISIVDKNGKEVISLGPAEIGTGLSVYRPDGSKAAQFGMSNAEQAGGLVLFDDKGRARFGIGMDEGVPSLAVIDTKGHKRVTIVGDDNRCGIAVLDSNEKQRAALGVLDDNPAVFLADEAGEPQIGMRKSAEGYRVGMVNKDGVIVELGD